MAESEKSLKKPESKSKPKKKDKKKKHKVRSMHIQPADNGGFVVNHDNEPDEDDQSPQSSIHAVGDLAQLHQHLDDHFGDQAPSAGMQAPPAAQAAPPAAAGAAMGGM